MSPTSASDSFSISIRYSSAPGSIAPVRVPIISPSIAEKPMVVATLRSPRIAHRLAPLPRCATTQRPCASSPWRSARAVAMYS